MDDPDKTLTSDKNLDETAIYAFDDVSKENIFSHKYQTLTHVTADLFR